MDKKYYSNREVLKILRDNVPELDWTRRNHQNEKTEGKPNESRWFGGLIGKKGIQFSIEDVPMLKSDVIKLGRAVAARVKGRG